MYGALYRRYPAARREGAVFDQRALDILLAGDRGVVRGDCVPRSVAHGRPALFCLAVAAVSAVVALYKMMAAWFHRWTTETDVTNLRVVHKTGFIKRRTFEMSLDKVESVDVNQSILGRILNYGNVTILGVGEGKETITTIASPLEFRNFITAR
jgi:uncharacterized membrane protein YdbT with pleckstrin-like domain